jgi:hypothetical protein
MGVVEIFGCSISILLAPIQVVDKTTFVEFLDKPCVDEILWLGHPSFGRSFRQHFQHCLDSRQRRILLAREYVIGDGYVIALLQQISIANAP